MTKSTIICGLVHIMLFVVVYGGMNSKEWSGRALHVNTNGSEHCMSDCSTRRKTNTLLGCSMQECTQLKQSRITAEKPDLIDISFEIFKTTTGRNELSLKVKWSPSDDATVKSTEGYMVEVSDGFTKYSSCYEITDEMDFHTDIKDIFYSDCYGKAQNTKILLGSIIFVSITSLPIWSLDNKSTQRSATVTVPDCSYKPFYSLSECEAERNLEKDCARNCSMVMNDSIAYPISCSISRKGDSRKSGECPQVKRTQKGTPSDPHSLEGSHYKYMDVETGEIKLALNFSWSPGDDGSITSLVGYYLKVLHKDSESSRYLKCLSIHTQLEEEKHIQAKFYHDCYGRDNVTEVEPNNEYVIHVSSLPGYALDNEPPANTMKIKVPSCADPGMLDVNKCKKANSMKLGGYVEDVYCSNVSVKYRYHVTPEYGETAKVIFCEIGDATQTCKNDLQKENGLKLSGTLYNFSLPSSANLSSKYSVFVSGSGKSEYKHNDTIDFSVCKEPEQDEDVMKAILACLVVVFFLSVVFLLCLVYRKRCNDNMINKLLPRCWTKKPDQSSRYKPPISPGHGSPNSPLSESRIFAPAPVRTMPEKWVCRVYVLFMEDNELHSEVVHWFCSYLKADLGLDVRIHIWENSAAMAPAQYMMSNLKNADKVIIICSAGTRDCLDRADDTDNFTPAVKQIINKAFVGSNPGKYLVGYFDYSFQEDVPELLRDQTMLYCSLFKLMKNFESFFFRLIGMEQYQEGGIVRIEKIAFDQYYDPALTRCGLKLKMAIDRMKSFVTANPTWFTDRQGSGMAVGALPPVPSSLANPGPIPTQTVDCVHKGVASINLLQLTLPPNISGSQVPKVHPAGHTTHGEHVADDSLLSEELTSFMISETEVENYSEDRTMRSRITSRDPDPSEVEHQQFPLCQAALEIDPSFFTNDFSWNEADQDSCLLTYMPSKETQITRIGMPHSYELQRLEELANLLFSANNEGDDDAPLHMNPESGVVALANIDDGDIVDIENEFMSINQMC